ncbi:MAG: hypothetical protein M3N07_06065 [Pseudomonadota bacterium]|nr:hypothetical protein [Pseudomonadota bacterium]
MRDDREAMMVVRAELCDRLDQLRRLSGQAPAADFEARLDGIRTLAGAYGLRPVACLAEALQRGGGPRALYLERIADAIGCERADEEAVQAMLASVSVRLGA